MWLDSHCHVTAHRFDEDRAEVLSRLEGVDEIVSIGSGYGIAGNAEAIALAETDERIWATVGVHPRSPELDDENRAPSAPGLPTRVSSRSANADSTTIT